MGTYNIVTVPVGCRVCGLVSERDLQLHYGEKRMHHYRVGDRLLWSSGDGVRVGDPAAPRVWCPCYAAAPCPACGDDADCPGFAVVIDQSVISAVFQAPPGTFYPETPEWTALADGEQPTATVEERDAPARTIAATALSLQAALCALLGIVDHDDKPDSAVRPTHDRILDTVTLMRRRLEILTATDRATADLRASVDEHIRAGRNIMAVKTIRERLDCSIPEAVEILNDRFLVLRQPRRGD
jgi:hypothetical protein